MIGTFFKKLSKGCLHNVCYKCPLFLYLEGPSRKMGIAGAVVGCFFENPDSIKTLKDERSFSDSKWGSPKKCSSQEFGG